MTPVILFRKNKSNIEEYKIACRFFPTYIQRAEIPEESLVIGRYSVLPFYQELERDIDVNYSKLINTYQQHNFIADIQEWSSVLREFTPETWFSVTDIPLNKNKFIIKGKTNSRKTSWNKKMYVDSREELGFKIANLIEEPFISDQEVCIREYVPLNTITIGANELPITMEFRIFILNNKILDYAYYWSSYIDEVKEKLGYIPFLSDDKAFKLIEDVINKIKDEISAPTFYVIDIAQTQNKDWILIELNDGQMSGLSEIDPIRFYKNLNKELNCI